MKKVLIPTKLDAIARETLEKNGNYLVIQDEETGLPGLAAEHSDTHAIIVRSDKVTSDIIDALPKLKVVIRAGAGYNTIDTEHAKAKDVAVMNTPGANSNAVAEEVIALMLADARHIVEADPSARSGKWEKKKFMGREITGKTVGLVGFGHIGQLIAKRLSGFDVNCLCYDPNITDETITAKGGTVADLETIFSKSDYVSLHLPENAETRGMINSGLLMKMKPGATLVNCARAGVVNEDDIRSAKKEPGIRFLNDVYAADKEGVKSVADIADVMLPHLGASTYEANRNAAQRSAEQLIAFDEQGDTTYVVNK